jgi:TRAP-type C4-dicarboxylate transport system substrate-binding protein
MMKSEKILRGALLLSVLALPCLGGAAVAQDKPVALKLSHWVPPAHPLQAAMEQWAESVKQDSNGTITSTIFPSEQLGKAFDHYDMARDAIADFTYVSPGYQPGRFPIMDAPALPFQIANGHGGSKAVDAWYRKYAEREMKDVHLCFAFTHAPGTFHSRTKILVPADIKNMKVRPAHATMGNFVTLLGGTNVQASAPAARDLLERGTADAITFPWGSIILFGIDKVVKYHMDAPLYTTPFVWIMNKDKYDSMSANQKKVIDNHCTTEWAEKFAGPWSDFEDAGIAKIKAEPGHDVYPLTAEQLAEWKKAAEPLVKIWADSARKTGIDPELAMTELHAELVKYDAALK